MENDLNNKVVIRDELIQQIEELAPWHYDIRLTNDLSTGQVFSKTCRLSPPDNHGVSLRSPRQEFTSDLAKIYPDGMAGLRFMDCACNSGANCFLVKELGADRTFGFDVREHWIHQAEFVRRNRISAPVDGMEFRRLDLYDLPKQNLESFDMTYFGGVFYHLPDPVTGLKYAADLTKDIIVVSTACLFLEDQPPGLTIQKESTEHVMSGVYELAWVPNNPKTLKEILNWLGFQDVKLVKDMINETSNRRRVKVYAGREPGRLETLGGTYIQ